MNIDASRVGTSGGTREVPETDSRGKFVYGQFKKCSTENLSLGRFPTNFISACDLTQVLPQARSAGMYPSESQGTGSGVPFLALKSQGRLYADHGSATRFFKQVTL